MYGVACYYGFMNIFNILSLFLLPLDGQFITPVVGVFKSTISLTVFLPQETTTRHLGPAKVTAKQFNLCIKGLRATNIENIIFIKSSPVSLRKEEIE